MNFISKSLLIAAPATVLLVFLNSCTTAEPVAEKTRNEVLEMTAMTRGMMGAQVMSRAMTLSREKGPAFAAEFCSENAAAMTESIRSQMEKQFKETYKIKEFTFGRASQKNRNPVNVPDEALIPVLEKWEKEISRGNVPDSEVVKDGQNYYGALPILISAPACLKCHGSPESGLDAKAADVIKSRYPNDKATGFKEGNLRGVFWAKINY